MEKYEIIDSPIGRLGIKEKAGEITEINWVSDLEVSNFQSSPVLEKGKKQLEEYFCGKRKYFDLPYQIEGTDFQQKVWKELEKIPYGTTCTYGEIAVRIGKPKAARAVGNACNKNKIPILIPCHRVVGANGSLTGFAGGLEVKEHLLKLEKEQGT